LAAPTGLSIANVLGETGVDIQQFYDEIIAYKNSDEGKKYNAIKQQIDEYQNILIDLSNKMRGQKLQLANGTFTISSVYSSAIKHTEITFVIVPPVGNPYIFKKIDSIFSMLPEKQKLLFADAYEIEKRKPDLEEELSDLRQKFRDDHEKFDLGAYTMPFDTTVDDDIKNRDALILSAQKFKNAEAAFMDAWKK